MKTLQSVKNIRQEAQAGEDLGLLVTLLRESRIGYRMLVQNIAEICADDYDLIVQAVLIVTDKERIKATDLSENDYENAIIKVGKSPHFKGVEIVIAALQDAMQKTKLNKK